jgi:uncharacterized protein YggE
MHRTTAISLLLSALLAPVAAQAQSNPVVQSPVPSIVTRGEATVRRPPDQAFVVAAVESRAKTPRDAQQQNATGMTALLQKVTSAGIPREAVRTLGYTIQQEVDFVNGRRVPRDYVARNAVEIRIDAIERAGDILDALVQGGATSVDRVRFDVKDRSAVEREALRLAVADARGRADAAAAGAGQTITRVLRIEDSRAPDYKQPMPMMAMRAAAAAEAATPIEPAVIEIHAEVTLTVAIQ